MMLTAADARRLTGLNILWPKGHQQILLYSQNRDILLYDFAHDEATLQLSDISGPGLLCRLIYPVRNLF